MQRSDHSFSKYFKKGKLLDSSLLAKGPIQVR